MKILFLSLYFPPDLSAGAFRSGPLVEALGEALSPEDHLDVIAAQPTRYDSYSINAPETEEIGCARVRRVALPPHQNGFKGQIRSYSHFARQVYRLTANTRYDLVIATSSRLMTATLGAAIARRDDARLCLDIRDIFVDTIQDILPRRLAFVVVPIFRQIERWTIGRAALVNLVSEGFKPYFEARYPETQFTYLTNGIDDAFLAADLNFSRVQLPSAPIRMLYAGNVGEGQGLHRILPDLAEAMASKLDLIVFGDGGMKAQLAREIVEKGLDNITLHKPIGRYELLAQYKEADVLFLHLNDHNAFRKVLPSKLFEYAATGKPILAGISGYARSFAEAEIPNIGLFDPCDALGAVAALNQLDLHQTDRRAFINRFGRRTISGQLARHFLDVM